MTKGFSCLVGTTDPLHPVKYPGLMDPVTRAILVISNDRPYSVSRNTKRLRWNSSKACCLRAIILIKMHFTYALSHSHINTRTWYSGVHLRFPEAGSAWMPSFNWTRKTRRKAMQRVRNGLVNRAPQWSRTFMVSELHMEPWAIWSMLLPRRLSARFTWKICSLRLGTMGERFSLAMVGWPPGVSL